MLDKMALAAKNEGEGEESQQEQETEDTGEGEEQLFAGKFKDPADLEKAYLELQSRFSKEKAQPKEEGSKDPAFQIPTEGQAAEAAAPAFQAEKYQQEFMESGDLSAESRAEMEKLGIPKEMVDTHVAGLRAIRDARASAIKNIFGGEDRMGEVTKWAGANLSPAEIHAIETQANSLDMATCEAAIKGLVARFDASPFGASALEGTTGGPAVAPFKSNKEMTEAMADPRYKDDPAYRADVARRIAGM